MILAVLFLPYLMVVITEVQLKVLVGKKPPMLNKRFRKLDFPAVVSPNNKNGKMNA